MGAAANSRMFVTFSYNETGSDFRIWNFKERDRGGAGPW